jgi:hypothetical protein
MMPVRRTITLADYFWAKVDRRGVCWFWQASHRPAGYGTYYVNRQPKLAHRVAFTGTIQRVTVDVSGEKVEDREA